MAALNVLREQLAAEAGALIGYTQPAAPTWVDWKKDGAPLCDQACRYFVGQRCILTGERPADVCEPTVNAMMRRLVANL